MVKFTDEFREKAEIERLVGRSVWPLTPAERRIAAKQRMNPDSTAYNVCVAYSLSGELDVKRLKKALETLISRNRILRSYYPEEDGVFVHRIADESPVSLDIRKCGPDELPALVGAPGEPFDISRDRLYRFTLYEVCDEKWALSIVMHHLIMDAASLDLMVEELWDLYRLYEDENYSDATGTEPDYLDYSVWLSENDDTGSEIKYFMDVFADGAPENEMPIRSVRPDSLPFATESLERVIDVSALAAAAKSRDVTSFTLLFAAISLTVAKYCGSEDVTLGVVMNGRNRHETASMKGLFANILPVRTKPAGDMRFDAYAERIRDALKGARANETCPFEPLVTQLAPDRNSSRYPIFDVVVNYVHEAPAIEMPNLTVRRIPIKSQSIEIDLQIDMWRDADKLSVTVSYSRDLYHDEIIDGIMEQFTAIIDRITGPDGESSPLSDIAELPERQRDLVLRRFTGERSDENLGRIVPDLFREMAKVAPERPAVVFAGRAISYGELDKLTDALSASLADRGVSRGDKVGVLVRRNEFMIICALGALKAGAAFVPLDPGYPSERLSYMLQNAGARVVMADKALIGLLSDYDGEFITSDDIRDMDLRSVRAPLELSADDGFVLLYTSGTTGQPKGVLLTHGNLTNFCAWFGRCHKLTEDDKVAAYASFGFDASLMDIYPALTHGACVHIIPEEMRLDLPRLNDYFNENGVTVAFMTTQLGRQFVESLSNRSLRVLGVGGETLVPIAPPDNFALYNCYGPTECSILSTFFRVDRLYSRVPLGRPLANTDIYIVDGRGRLAPIGASGELCIAGRQVSAGYLNRPELSAEKFVKNPFNDDPEYSRMYRTGDVARYLPNGDLDFIGRRDFQVKIRGFRVELTEIELRIRAYPGVKDAAVLACDAPGGGKCAIAYVASDPPIDVPALERFIEDELPRYMVPAATMSVDSIPLTQNGKVDRRRLPAPVFGASTEGNIEVRPKTEMELAIADVLSEILGHGEFDLSTNLMRSGLTSLSAIRFRAKLYERFGTSPQIRELMKSPTILGVENAIIRNLLASLREKPDVSEAADGAPDEKYEKTGYPLSQSQMGVCFDCMKRPDSVVYNIPFRIDLPPIDAARLTAVTAAVIDAHPVVKSHLAMYGEEVRQVPEDAPANVPCDEVSSDELERIAADFARPFPLFTGPLYRARVLTTPEGVTLLADFHHIVFDGGSLDIFLREIGELYGDVEFPKKARVAREKISCFDWSVLEKKNEGSAEWLEDKAYFDAQLSSFEESSEISPDLVGGSKKPSVAEVALPVDRSAAESFCRLNGTSLAGLFLAALSYAISRWTYSPNVYIATISSGRSDTRLQNSFGMFVRTLPLALRADSQADGDSSLDFVRSCQIALTDAVAHEGYPFTRIAQEKRFEPTIMYACQLGLVEEHNIGGVPARVKFMDVSEPMFKISVFVEEREGEIVYAIQYDDSNYSRGMMERFAETVVTALGNIESRPNAPLRGVSLVSREAARLLAGFNKTDGELPEPVLHRMFEASVSKNPDKIALFASEGEYTYAMLDAEANKVANALLARGVLREDRIGFLLHRTGRVVIAMFGILKAGCAYIPIDPEYPAERIDHVLNDSGAKFLLTTSDEMERRGTTLRNAIDIDSMLAGADDKRPDVEVSPDQLAYLIYTSGSTGKPKGVMIEHRGIANFVTNHPKNEYVEALVRENCTMFSITTVAFDMFTIDTLIPLCNGLAVVLADDEESRDPVRMADLFSRTGADAVSSTPTRMLDYTEYPALLEAVRGCKVIISGGEKYPEALLARLRNGRKYDSGLFNIYGPTEISVACNSKDVTRAERITVGPPLLGVHEMVVDSDGNALPPRIVGELWTGGRGVARGYINRPEQTAERFVMSGGERVYKCGDFARWTDDGEIEILGRNDNQIKLRGLRIELGEIESAISSIEGVRSCVVMIRRIQNSDHLAAYYVADNPINPLDMKKQLSQTLTPYMTPTAYKQMDVMPKTPNGKNDLRALPEPELLNTTDYEAPRTPLEETLCSIFGQVLGLERVGANDSFFDIGGSSLAVTRVVIKARERVSTGGAFITYGDVFAHPTPRELAALLAGGGSAVSAPEHVVIEPDYDYSRINELLAQGTILNFRKCAKRPLGDVILTGATGFLGAHVLRALLSGDGGAIYCLMRRGRYDSVEERLRKMLYYYFEDDFGRSFGGRLHAVEGDITKSESIDSLMRLPVGTVINCAANVTHFAKDSSITDVNTGGVLNLIEFALARRVRLVQISTASVAGFSVEGTPPHETMLDETMLYFGQNLENQYIHSKFMAERAILEAVSRGLDAKIMRVGNLMARNNDGEFQINSHANSFLGQLRAYQTVGAYPYSGCLQPAELSPIDSTAQAILLLADAPEECRVFHPFSNYRFLMGDIISAMRDEGMDVNFVEDEVFNNALSEAMKDPARAERLTSLIAYQNVAQGRSAVMLDAKNDYTSQALYRLGWSWPEETRDYLRRFLRGMIGLGFFGRI
ncbi:MAG: amino acid adenylation domain-containing protein [Synergistaceae bacterium]|jgi:amino acid adenylation domain-containing protein|nr:amino acid adenylation domain-containing protein [Synergistaceae bacterium]